MKLWNPTVKLRILSKSLIDYKLLQSILSLILFLFSYFIEFDPITRNILVLGYTNTLPFPTKSIRLVITNKPEVVPEASVGGALMVSTDRSTEISVASLAMPGAD